MAMTRVLMKTLLGNMTLELDGDKAPATVANFVEYAQSGHYDGTIFHRVMNNFLAFARRPYRTARKRKGFMNSRKF